MSSDVSAKFASLRSRVNSILTQANLSDRSREVGDMTAKVVTLPGDIQKIRSRGYAFASYMEQKAEALKEAWEGVRQQVQHAINDEVARLRPELTQVEHLMIQGDKLAGSESALAGVVERIENELGDLENKIRAASTRIQGIYSTVQRDINQTFQQLVDINWYLDQKDEASFKFLANEALFLVAKAEWVATGKGGDDPDGLLYLTDMRLIFEQKEKTGKKLGFFGGKETQEVEWEIPLNQIEDVTAENKGLFGGKDMLYFTMQAGAPHSKITVEVKGGVKCKFWAAQIQRMISGGTSDERAIQPDPEFIENLRNAPTDCQVCGATLPQLVAGQIEAKCQYCGSVVRI